MSKNKILKVKVCRHYSPDSRYVSEAKAYIGHFRAEKENKIKKWTLEKQNEC